MDTVTGVDREFVRSAVEQADLNALRMALYHATGDPALARMRLVSTPVRGGSTSMVVVADEHREEILERAVKHLMRPGAPPPAVPLTDDELRELMRIMTGDELTEREFRYRRNFLAFDEFPITAEWTGERPGAADDFSVAVIGAGFSGLAAGVQLGRLGIPYTVYESRADLGGTWSRNTYPDARVDTSSFTYQYGFEHNYPWSEYFARQAEVQGYLEHVAKRFRVWDNIRFNALVEGAQFDPASNRWTLAVRDADGRTESVTVNAIISASGLFNLANRTDIAGIEDFAGRVVHTAEWHDEPVDGRRVAVIGNGSTGVQVLSQIADMADRVHVLQRTPQWIAPREKYGEPISPELRWLFDTMPAYWNWYCYGMLAMGIRTQDLQTCDPHWLSEGGLVSRGNDMLRESLTDYISAQVNGDPDLVERLVPSYPPMARRLIVDNGWYRALVRDNVELVSERIVRVVPEGIELADGRVLEVDLILLATGFAVTKYLWPTQYVGPDGQRLEQTWDAGDGPRAYLGILAPEFPNLFVIYGPNSQARTGSLPSWIETWTRYSVSCVVAMIEAGHRRVTVRRAAFERYNAELDAACDQLVWGLVDVPTSNYYVHASGRQLVNCPWRVEDFYARLERLDFADLDFA